MTNKKKVKSKVKAPNKKTKKIKGTTEAASPVNDVDSIVDGPARDFLEMQQADGKIYNKHNVRSIDELLGINTNKYSTHDISKYEQMLNDMNTSDLQSHAISVQILPKEDRRLLIQLLLKQFRINNSSFLNPAEEIPGIKKKITKETLRILSEGK